MLDGPLSADELRIWQSFNTSLVSEDRRSLCGALSDAATNHSSLPAVITSGQTLTYGELRALATVLVDRLQQLGVGVGDHVAVLADRRVGDYIAIYALAMMGAVYVPVAAPPAVDTVQLLVRTHVQYIVGAAENLEALAGTDFIRCRYDDLGATASAVEKISDSDPSGVDGLLYIIHTSGTSGAPKGVCIPRRAVLNLARWYVERHEVVSGDRLSQNAPLTFDPSAQQMFSAWLSGAAVVVIPEQARRDPAEMMAWLSANDITHLDMVTAHWIHLCGALEARYQPMPRLRWVIVAGETMHLSHCERWFSSMKTECRLHNVYGPTETTVNATQFEVDRRDLASLVALGSDVPIGTPLPGHQVYLVDDRDELCPPGLIGQIVISGEGLAAGYYNDSALTGMRFVELDLQGQGRLRVYKTGDLGELVDLGCGKWKLRFRGRRDDQIKVSGYRVELKAIEAGLNRFPGIDHAAVMPRGEPADRLACFYVGPARPNDVRVHIDRIVPSYVAVGDIIRLNSLPITESGKLDRSELLSTLKARRQPEAILAGVHSPIETAIEAAWETALGVTSIHCDFRFRAAGGTSLAAFQIAGALQARGLDVRGSDFLKDPTIRECAQLASARVAAAVTTTRRYTRIEWSEDIEIVWRRVHAVWDAPDRSAIGYAPCGPLTAAWLTDPRRLFAVFSGLLSVRACVGLLSVMTCRRGWGW